MKGLYGYWSGRWQYFSCGEECKTKELVWAIEIVVT